MTAFPPREVEYLVGISPKSDGEILKNGEGTLRGFYISM